jgi:hypothetical protein
MQFEETATSSSSGVGGESPGQGPPDLGGSASTGSPPSPMSVERWEQVSVTSPDVVLAGCKELSSAEFRAVVPGRVSLARAQYALDVGARVAPLSFLDLDAMNLLLAEPTSASSASMRLIPPSELLDPSTSKFYGATLELRIATEPSLRPATHLVVLVDVGIRMQPLAELSATVLRSAFRALEPDKGDLLTVVAFAAEPSVVVGALSTVGDVIPPALDAFLKDLEAGSAMQSGHDVVAAMTVARDEVARAGSTRTSYLLLTDAERFEAANGSEAEALSAVEALRSDSNPGLGGFHVAQLARRSTNQGLPALRTERLDAIASAGRGTSLFFSMAESVEAFFGGRALAILHASDDAPQPVEVSVFAQRGVFPGVEFSTSDPMMTPEFARTEPFPFGLLRVIETPMELSCPWIDATESPIPASSLTLTAGLIGESFDLEPLMDPAFPNRLVDRDDATSRRLDAIRASVLAGRQLASSAADAEPLVEHACSQIGALRKSVDCATNTTAEACGVAAALEQFLGRTCPQ